MSMFVCLEIKIFVFVFVINIRRFFFTLVAVTILWLETNYPDGSRSSKLPMGQHKPVLRA